MSPCKLYIRHGQNLDPLNPVKNYRSLLFSEYQTEMIKNAKDCEGGTAASQDVQNEEGN